MKLNLDTLSPSNPYLYILIHFYVDVGPLIAYVPTIIAHPDPFPLGGPRLAYRGVETLSGYLPTHLNFRHFGLDYNPVAGDTET
jgi:hypothetical protein